MADSRQWTVIFLVDQNPPQKIALLRRAATKTFAPNWYTGIGGKVGDLPGLEKETPLAGAYRELSEETANQLNSQNIELHEFAHCHYEAGGTLYYFWGQPEEGVIPKVNPEDGEINWYDRGAILSKKLIPTTEKVCEIWAQRDFSLTLPFSILERETGQVESVRLVELVKQWEGLGE